jgi:hypothetical protein
MIITHCRRRKARVRLENGTITSFPFDLGNEASTELENLSGCFWPVRVAYSCHEWCNKFRLRQISV